jgi:hypothetical protein
MTEAIRDLVRRFRPQVFLALALLGVIAVLAIRESLTEVSVGCIAGIIALAKDVITSDA